MTAGQLSVRLARLGTGQSELLTLPQFEAAFPGLVSREDQKQEAIELAAALDCSIHFIGLDDGYVMFTRQQGRSGGVRK